MIIGITGHRPKYFPTKYDFESDWYKKIQQKTRDFLIEANATKLIQGLCIGFDMMAAEIALDLEIELFSYVPFMNQESKWPEESKNKYIHLLGESTGVFLCHQKYRKSSFFHRDELMVDHSDEMLCLLNPEAKKGGTRHTVEYAKSKGKKVTNVWE